MAFRALAASIDSLNMADGSDEASVRMQRMLLILKKALDVSVHGASSVDLRATVEAAAAGDAALLARLPSGAEADELAATSVLSLRSKMEVRSEPKWRCKRRWW